MISLCCLFVNQAPVSVAWVSYLNVAILVGTLSLALFNASKDEVARNMAYAYAVISVGTLVSASRLYRFVGSRIQSVNIDLWLRNLSA